MSEQGHSVHGIARFLAACAVVMTIGVLLDEVIARQFLEDDRLRIKGEFLRLLRLAGFAPVWGAIGVTFMLVDRRARARGWWERGTVLIASVLMSATIAELLKLVIRRERPGAGDDAHFVFRSFWDSTFSSSGIGMPSSHAAVAFGGAFMLARIAPGSWPVAFAWACGCAATRIMGGAHYLSDAAVSGLLAYAVAWTLWSVARPRVGKPL